MAGLEPSLGPVGGRPAPLEGGITNHNYLVRFGERRYVLRLHGHETDRLGIDRGAERLANEAAAELGLAPAVAASFRGGLLTDYLDCRALEPQAVAARAGEIGRALRRFHDSGLELPVAFDVARLVADYAVTAQARGGQPHEEFAELEAAAARITALLPAAPPVPCHNDLLAGNLLALADGGVMIVDWEYAGMGEAYFDLGNLAVNNELPPAACEQLLVGYLGRTPRAGEQARLELMRLMSDVREAAWGFVQLHLSELEFDFLGYGRRHLERLRAGIAGGTLERLAAEAGA